MSFNLNDVFRRLYIEGIQEFNLDLQELTQNDPKAIQPKECKITLRNHQLTLLHKCIDFENNNQMFKKYNNISEYVIEEDYFKPRIGVIADRAGSGKSYVIIALILSNNIVEHESIFIKSLAYNYNTLYFNNRKKIIKTNMIVIPHNLSGQWEKYILLFNDKIKYTIINKQKICSELYENQNIEDYEIIIVTTTFFNTIAAYLTNNDIKLQRIIFDEVDNLNMSSCIHLHANFIWCITSSYGNILYPKGHSIYNTQTERHVYNANGIKHNGFIKNIFLDLHMNVPMDFIKTLILKNSDEYINNSLNLPEVNNVIIKCKTPNLINILNGIVDKNIINSLNAGDVQTAMSFITNKDTEENIIAQLILSYDNLLKNLNVKLIMTNSLIYDDDSVREQEDINIKNRINDVQTKINLIKERVKTNNLCSICYDDVENKCITNCCQNSFCFKCIHLWLDKKRECPLCKAALSSKQLYLIDNNKIENEIIIENEVIIPENELHEEHDKLTNFKILLKEKKNGKILIFSRFDYTFSKIIIILKELGMSFDQIKGNTNTINKIINRYRSNLIDILLINTSNYGIGLNLENTTDLIMFHKFDSQLEQQIIGRAQRIGRTDPLNVYYLLHENEC